MSILYDYIRLNMYQEFLIFSKGMLKIPYLSGFFYPTLENVLSICHMEKGENMYFRMGI